LQKSQPDPEDLLTDPEDTKATGLGGIFCVPLTAVTLKKDNMKHNNF
jgi:hypothetical protein